MSQDPTHALRRLLTVEAAAGAVVGAALWALPVLSAFDLPLAERLIALGPLVVAPLAVEAALRGMGAGWPRRLGWMLGVALPIGALAATSSLLIAPGPLSGALAVVWAAVTGLVALLGLARLLPRGPAPLPELAIDAGLLYLPVGGAWLVASRLGWDVMGFGPAITALTAAHFHFAGLAAGVATGQLGRLLSPRRPLPYALGATSVALTPILVAIGITASPVLEVATALILATGVLLVAGSALVALRRAPPGQRAATALLAAAQLVSAYTMALACRYAWGEWTERPELTIDRMVHTHGLINALGYALPSLLALRWLAPAATPGEDDVPFARIGSRGFVGPDHLERRGLIVASAPAPRAITRSIDALCGLAPDSPLRIDREVARYYEDSPSVELVCRPRWRTGFRLLGRIGHALARRGGQVVLPIDPGPHRIGLRLAAVDATHVGLPGAVASIRTYADGSAMFVALYGEHEAGGRLTMDVALPLPLGALQSNLRGRPLTPPPGHDTGAGLELTSRPDDRSRHVGIWWLLGPIRVRLPLHETLIAWPARLPHAATDLGFDAPPGASLVAHHRFTLLGLPVLDLDYVVGPIGGAWASEALSGVR